MTKPIVHMSEIHNLKSDYGKIRNVPIEICTSCKQKFIPSPGAMIRCINCKYNRYGTNKKKK